MGRALTSQEFDWLGIVRRVGRSRQDFSITMWHDLMTDSDVVRLMCNCCGAWAQQAIPYERIVDTYNTAALYEAAVEKIVRFLLGVQANVQMDNVLLVAQPVRRASRAIEGSPSSRQTSIKDA